MPVESFKSAGSYSLMYGGWSHDDELIYAGVMYTTAKVESPIIVWDSHRVTVRHTLDRHTGKICSIRLSPLSRSVLLSAGHDGRICLWDVGQGCLVRELFLDVRNPVDDAPLRLDCFECRFSPDGRRIAATDVWGQLWLFGIDPAKEDLKIAPSQQFFHSDYDPVIRFVLLLPFFEC